MKSLILLLTGLLCVSVLTSCGNQTKMLPEMELPEAPAYSENLQENKKIHKSSDGVMTIKPTPNNEQATEIKSVVTPETVWKEKTSHNEDESFTVPTKEVVKKDGSLGTLSIATINLQMSVFETEKAMEDIASITAMKKGAAHFKNTSMWNGNVGLSAHNGGVPDSVSFGKLHELKKGDNIVYVTELGERSYEVSDIQTISDDDWSYLSRTDDNRITLITCVSGEPDKRLVVQAVEKTE